MSSPPGIPSELEAITASAFGRAETSPVQTESAAEFTFYLEMDDPDRACWMWCDAMAARARRREFAPEGFVIAGLNFARGHFPEITDPALAARVAIWICAVISVIRPGDPECDHWETTGFEFVKQGAAPAACLAMGVVAAGRRVWHGVPLGRLSEQKLRLDALASESGNHEAAIAWIAARAHCDFVCEQPAKTVATVAMLADAIARAGQDAGDAYATPLGSAEFVRKLTTGKLDEARAYVLRAADMIHRLAPYDAWNLYLYKVALNIEVRDVEAALMDANRALAYARQCGVPHAVFWSKLAVARAYSIAAGTTRLWWRMADARNEARALRMDALLALCRLASALAALERGRITRAGVLARAALMHLERVQMLRPLLFGAKDFERLLKCADVVGSQQESFPILQRTHGDSGTGLPAPGERLSAKIEIRCLGTFSVKRGGVTLSWQRKAPRRPLDLLKATIAYGAGGASVPQLTDALWPDMEGDRAQRAFGTALYRLRRMLGEGVLNLSAGRLRLDPDHTWVDVFEFENVISRCDSEGSPCDQTLFGVYGGVFLPDEAEAAWALTARERLRERFRNAARRAADNLLLSGRWHDALDYLDHALGRDSLAEIFYQSAIAACLAGGLRAEASSYYERCRRVLSEHLGVHPSRKTESLYQDVLQSAR